MQGDVSRPPWYARSGLVLGSLGVLVTATALFVRQPVSGRAGDPRLSTFSTEPLGAKLLYETLQRSGYAVRRERWARVPNDPSTVLAVLEPTIALRPVEVHALLEHARGGGALLIVLGAGTDALGDSLGVRMASRGGMLATTYGDAKPCESAGTFIGSGLWFGGAVQLLPLEGRRIAGKVVEGFVFVSPASRTARSPRPVVAGIEYGKGRIVIAADPDVFRNDALRECRYGLDIAALRAIEYLRDGGVQPRTTIVFDEFHLERNSRSGIVGVVQTYMRESPSGHAVLQLCAAGLLLLLAAMPRVLPPRDERVIERRSPLEHVDALARAYAQVGATRTATLRLVRGLQRRVDRTTAARSAGGRTADRDEQFLARIESTTPSLSGDVSIVRRALNESVPPDEFEKLGLAIHRIESALTRT